MKSLKSQLFYLRAIQILLPTFALLAGGLIYAVFRKSDFVFFQWIDYLGLSNLLIEVREFFSFINFTFPNWIVFSLPSGLWAFAYTFIIVILWYKNHSFVRYFWYSSIPLLVFGFEFLQCAKIVPGTFSFGDILSSLIGLFFGVYIGLKSSKI